MGTLYKTVKLNELENKFIIRHSSMQYEYDFLNSSVLNKIAIKI